MGIRIVKTGAGAAPSPAELDLIRDAVAANGRTVLVAGSRAAADVLRAPLARAGIGLGVDVLAPAAWISSLWDLLGDGRRLVGARERALAMAAVQVREGSALEPLEANAGTARELAAIARDLAPWLPAGGDGLPGAAWRAVDRAVSAYRELLSSHGLVEPSEAALALAAEVRARRPRCARSIIVRDIDSVPAYLVELLAAAGEAGEVAVLLGAGRERLAGPLAETLSAAGARVGEATVRAPEAPRRAVPDFLEAAGPHVRLAAYADEIARLARERPREASPARVIVASPVPLDLARELAGHLAARGLAATARGFARFSDTEAGRQLAALQDLAGRLGAPDAAGDGRAAWWPAPELTDWFCCPLSGMDLAAARELDRYTRGRRALTPDALASMLRSIQSRRAARVNGDGPWAGVPAVGASVFEDVRRGRILPALKTMLDVARALPPSAFGGAFGAARLERERRALEAAVDFLEGPVRELRAPREAALAVLPTVAVGVSLSSAPADGACCEAAFMTLDQAALLGAGSSRGALLADMDADGYSLAPEAGPRAQLAAALGRAGASLDAAPALRRAVDAVLASQGAVAFSRVSHDGQAKERFAAAPWTELAMARKAAEAPDADDMPFVRSVGEARIFGDLDPAAGAGAVREPVFCATPQHLRPAAARYLEPKRLEDGPEGPRLAPRRFSASQLESYAECPLCWFVSYRLRPASLDAVFGEMGFGYLVHEVLHRFYEGRVERGEGRVSARDEAVAIAELRAVFDAVRSRHEAGRSDDVPVVPHSPVERAQVDAILPQLEDAVRFEASSVSPFQPKLLEYSFDSLGATYAGRPFGGKIDRVDVDGRGRAVVVDYKHRARSTAFNVRDPLADDASPLADPDGLPGHLQTLIYAQILRCELGLDPRAALYLMTKGSPVIMGAASEELVDDGSGAAPLPGVREGFPAAPGGMSFGELLDHVEAAIARRLDALEAGVVAPADPPAPGCPNRHPLIRPRRTL